MRTVAGLNSSRFSLAGPPCTAAVAAAQFLPGDPAVFAAQPSDHPVPCVGAQVLEGGLGHPGLEVGAPAPQHPVELDEQDIKRQARAGSAGPRLDLAHDGLDGLAGWIGVDVVPVRAPLPVTLDVPAEEVEALVDVGDQGLFLRQAQ